MSISPSSSYEQLKDCREDEFCRLHRAVTKIGQLDAEREELVSKVQYYYNILWIFGFFMYIVYGGRIYDLEQEITIASISEQAAFGMIQIIDRRLCDLQNDVTATPQRSD